MLKDRMITGLTFVLLVIALITGVYFIGKEDVKSEVIVQSNDKTSMSNAKKYINALNKMILEQSFYENIIDGTYIIEKNEIINSKDKSINYLINLSNNLPLTSSLVYIKDNTIEKATLYYTKEVIIYKNGDFSYKK